MTILAIDPGDKESAFCFVDSDTLEPGFFGKVPNEQLLGYIHAFTYDKIVIERIASYGMAVGRNHHRRGYSQAQPWSDLGNGGSRLQTDE